jgi:hypothetical protein
MFTHRIKGDVPQDNHLVVVDLEHHLEVLARVDPKAAEDLAVHLGYSTRCLKKPLSLGVIANRRQHLDYRSPDSVLVWTV